MLNIVLVEPEIPQNTGNVARTCACIGARLHLVEPMGFAVTYGSDAWLVFGRESRGLDEAVMQRFESACVRIPMRDGMRSLNLSNSVAIAAYEALRQQNWPGLA